MDGFMCGDCTFDASDFTCFYERSETSRFQWIVPSITGVGGFGGAFATGSGTLRKVLLRSPRAFRR
jgi:hypothetical protein